ncbi:fructose-bisphosphate aldolase [Micromonospora citrea]|uniref:Fructose-bisphosphate aldolase n=1 Tax=Micromonospora citrea TaxID=47855 RepID=A0A1C6VY28_9ACTN|nr:class II fructose-bisphosphate aldolase [Micromonospora citrea]SCL71107.1 fructose-bisphosphate aldolase [Micromonospora citrea]
MTLVPTADLVAAARAAGTGVLAFNVITIEHAQAIAAAARRAHRPAILQISQNAARYHGGVSAIAAATAEIARAAGAELSLHLDHVDDVGLLEQAPAAGFSSVMVDASALSYAANVAATRKATDWAHERGLWVEAELGHVGGKPDAPASAHAAGVRTDPAEAARYVAETGVDALAVAVGSTHAMADRTASLDLDLVAAIRDAVPVPLVLHGSSGVPLEQIRAAVGRGMVKINVGTALNVAFTDAVRAALPESRDPRRYLAAGRDAMAGVVERLLTLLPEVP